MIGVRASVGPSPQSTLMGTLDWVDPGYTNLRASESQRGWHPNHDTKTEPESEDDSTRLKEYGKFTRDDETNQAEAASVHNTHAGQARSELSNEMSDSKCLCVRWEHTTIDEVPECLVAQIGALAQDPSSLPGRPVGRLAEKGVACLPSNSRHRPLMGPRGRRGTVNKPAEGR
ncbi:hypothetical protein CTAM01_06239 [Colletotrichum tamarilloi]|uniref:Uncharacterized protein n=1 Tax=Colletotrichum tamarilloi TaxID=1209934 RepID=A0ABQ9RC24_9PEZI|nr:uncharacterized protein CTAM01_06239 [Colletotrichum tamarilloi]KAK1500787.1 hypothetical protein CTAM01_06239 [Colletotrichum tamarilloi]